MKSAIEVVRDTADRLEAALDQYGHPDWHVSEFLLTLRNIVKDAHRCLAELKNISANDLAKMRHEQSIDVREKVRRGNATTRSLVNDQQA